MLSPNLYLISIKKAILEQGINPIQDHRIRIKKGTHSGIVMCFVLILLPLPYRQKQTFVGTTSNPFTFLLNLCSPSNSNGMVYAGGQEK